MLEPADNGQSDQVAKRMVKNIVVSLKVTLMVCDLRMELQDDSIMNNCTVGIVCWNEAS